MSRISTKFTKLLGIKTPIVSANMAGVSGGRLAAEVTAAGGFGFIGLGMDTPIAAELALARQIVEVPSPAPVPVGVGALGWLLDKPDSPSTNLVTAALDEGVKAVWLSFGEDLSKWVQLVREHDAKTGKNPKTLLFIVVSTVEAALKAANQWKADVLVVQGIEAGGHGLGTAPPLHTLLVNIFRVLPPSSPSTPPILAAGGLCTGAQLASVLALGASGAVFGTRFVGSSESLSSPAQKAALVSASSEMAVRSMAFDRARATLGWPAGVDGRALKNAMLDDEKAGLDDEAMQKRANESTQRGESSHVLVWAGLGVGLVDSIRPAQELVSEIHSEAVEHLRASAKLISDD